MCLRAWGPYGPTWPQLLFCLLVVLGLVDGPCCFRFRSWDQQNSGNCSLLVGQRPGSSCWLHLKALGWAVQALPQERSGAGGPLTHHDQGW